MPRGNPESEKPQHALGDTTDCHNGLTANEIQQGHNRLIGATHAPARFAMIGDSHASRMTDAFSDFLAARNEAAITFNGSWCVPLMYLKAEAVERWDCVAETVAAFEHVTQRPDIDTVILVAEWANYTQGFRGRDDSNPTTYFFSEQNEYDWGQASPAQNPVEFKKALRFTLSFLADAGKTVILITPSPEHYFHVPNFLAHIEWYQKEIDDFSDLIMDQDRYNLRNAEVLAAILDVSKEYLFTVINVSPLFCLGGACSLRDADGHSLYEDDNHLSYQGAEKVIRQLSTVIE